MNEKIMGINRNFSRFNKKMAELMKTRNMTIQSLSKEAGIAVGTIQKLLTDPSCNPTISSIEAICNILGASISEMIGQDEKMNTLNGSSVYLLEWEELPISLDNIHQIFADRQRKTIKTSFPVGKNAFALVMRDNSMLPLFPEQATLIFDPEKIPKDNSYVLVQTNNYKTIMFKQLLIDEPFKYITSTNPLFRDNIIKLDGQDKIIAVLVQSQLNF